MYPYRMCIIIYVSIVHPGTHSQGHIRKRIEDWIVAMLEADKKWMAIKDEYQCKHDSHCNYFMGKCERRYFLKKHLIRCYEMLSFKNLCRMGLMTNHFASDLCIIFWFAM